MAREEEREVTKSLTPWFSKMCLSLKAFFGLFFASTQPLPGCIRSEGCSLILLHHLQTESVIPKFSSCSILRVLEILYLILKPWTE